MNIKAFMYCQPNVVDNDNNQKRNVAKTLKDNVG